MLSNLLSEPTAEDRKAFASVVGEHTILEKIKALGASVHEVRDVGRSFLAITLDQPAWREEAGQKAARERIRRFELALIPLLHAHGYGVDGASTGFSSNCQFYSHRLSASTRGRPTAHELNMISTITGND